MGAENCMAVLTQPTSRGWPELVSARQAEEMALRFPALRPVAPLTWSWSASLPPITMSRSWSSATSFPSCAALSTGA